jgi:hypothetical protein
MANMQNLWPESWERDNLIKSKAKQKLEIPIFNKQKYWKKNILKKIQFKNKKKTWINLKNTLNPWI